MNVWGAAPRPGREKFSLHPRHVCDVPTSTTQQEIQEIQEIQERPASGRRMRTPGDRQGAKRRAAGAVSGGAAERPTEPEAVRAPSCVFAGKPLRSPGRHELPLPCTPGTSDGRANRRRGRTYRTYRTHRTAVASLMHNAFASRALARVPFSVLRSPFSVLRGGKAAQVIHNFNRVINNG